MPDAYTKVRLAIGGGWSTDAGPSYGEPPQGGVVTVPWLTAAENVTWALDGWPKRLAGSERLNATAVTETAVAQTFEGVVDYWKQGTAGTEAQDRVAVVGTRYMKEDADGTWDAIATGKEATKHPCFGIFKDDCVIATTSNVDVPGVWDQSTYADLGGTPPNFSIFVEHRNRVFAAGVATNPSRLYYCEHLNHEDWTGSGAGSIDVAPDDGDRIVALASHKKDLIIFKGPHKGSIYRLLGASPTGDSPFVLDPWVSGVGGVAHNSVVRIADDLVFVSPIGIHSLNATAAYGDYVEAFLSRPIQDYFDRRINKATLGTTWGVNDRVRGRAVWTFAPSGNSVKSLYLVYDYRFQPGRWALWTGYVAANCLAILETARVHRLYAGTTTGYVQEVDRPGTFTLPDGTTYTSRVTTPALSLGTLGLTKQIEKGYLLLKPKGDYTLTVGYKRDGLAQQTVSLSQSGSGGVLGSFVLGTDVLGGVAHRVQPFEVEGDFREVELEIRHNVSGQDLEPHGLELHVLPTGESSEVV